MKQKTFVAGLLGLALAAPALAANIVLNNVDPPGVGFNDPTPAVPVGGNAGTTVGQQRLIAYQRALELWGKTLRSNVNIVVRGSFAGLSCTASGGTLAQAGANTIHANFAGAPLANHWYGQALANAIANADLDPANDDITANFNGNVGQPNCIAGSSWYYGLDSTPGPNQIDFLDVFMHEVAHGLGFQNFISEATGNRVDGRSDVYMANTVDLDLGRWNTLTAAQIVASAVNTGRVVWDGPVVTANAPLLLGPWEGIRLSGGLSKDVEYGVSAFGPAPNAGNFSGDVVIGTDTGGTSSTDGCEAITAPVAGKIALVDRGNCNFNVKVKNAQIAGATGVMIANNSSSGSFSPGGTDATITIPSVGISQADGNAIKGAGSTVSAAFVIDNARRAGMTNGFVRLYAPGVVALGSSISHFDVTASPSLLMEPFITGGLQASRSLDLTASLMEDIGWNIETLKVFNCDTGNVPSVLDNGQMLHADVDACAAAYSNSQFITCMANVANTALAAGLLTSAQHYSVLYCASRAPRRR